MKGKGIDGLKCNLRDGGKGERERESWIIWKGKE